MQQHKLYLTILILKASVPDREFSIDEPLMQQYFFRLSSFAASCTCLMVSGVALGISLVVVAFANCLLQQW